MFRKCSWSFCPTRLSLIRSGGAYPIGAPPSSLAEIHKIFQTQIGSIHKEKPLVECKAPAPLLTEASKTRIGWPSDKRAQASLLAHLYSGSYLRGSGLEGSSYGVIASYLECWMLHFSMQATSFEAREFSRSMIPLLQSLQQRDVEDMKVISGPKTFQSLQAHAIERMSQVLNHPEGEPFLMPGGWSGSPGHAMLYEFTRRGNTFDFRLFNTGAGVSHHSTLSEGTKNKICPIVFLQSIPESHLNSGFFQALLEPMILPAWKLSDIQDKPDLLARHIYTTVFSLGGELVPDSEFTGFITAQRAGTCVCDSLLSFMRYKSGSLALFEQLRFNILSGALNDAYASWKHDLTELDYLSRKELQALKIEDPRRSRLDTAFELGSLLDHSARILLSHSVKPHFLKSRAWFSSEEARLAQNLGNSILFGVGLAYHAWIEKGLIQKSSLDWNKAGSDLRNPQNRSSSYFHSILGKAPLIAPKVERGDTFLESLDGQSFLPENIDFILENQLKRISSGDWTGPEIQLQIQWLSEALPIPTIAEGDFWMKIPQNLRLSCMEKIHRILEMYLNRFNPESITIFPEEQNVILKFMAIQHAIAVQYEKSFDESFRFLVNYQIALPTKSQETDPYLAFFSPRTLNQRQKVIDYFTEFNRLQGNKPELHDFDKAFAPLPADAKEIRQSLIEREEFQYYLRLTKSLEIFHSAKVNMPPNTLSEKQKIAFECLMRPKSLYDNFSKDKLHLYYLQQSAFFSFIAGNQFSGGKDIWWSNILSNQQVKFEFKHKDHKGSSPFTAYHPFFFADRFNLGFFSPVNASEKLHVREPGILSSLERRAYKPIRFSSAYALRPRLQTEGIVLPDISSRNVQEPLARPLQVLDLAEHSISRFKDRKEQELFRIDLLRSDLLDPHSNTFTMPLQVLCKDPDFVARCAAFLEEGLKFFWIYPQKNHRDLNTALYFIRLAQQIKPWIPKTASLPKIFQEDSWRKWILEVLKNEKNLSTEERQSLHLHLVLSYEFIRSEDITDLQWQELLISWFSLDRNLGTNPKFSPSSCFSSMDIALRHFSYFKSLLLSSPELQKTTAKTICHVLSPRHANLEWGFDQNTGFLSAKSEKSPIFIDIQRRSFIINGEESYQTFSLPEDVLHIAGRKRLFGNRISPLYLYSKSGSYEKFAFEDSVWGQIEIHKNGTYFKILRIDEKGKKYLFIPELSDFKDMIPLSVQYKSVFWVPLKENKEEWDTSQNCLLCNPSTGKELYQFSLEKGLIRDGNLRLVPSLEPLFQIESKEAVLSWTHEKEGLAHIEYPFYFSSTGQGLGFDLVSDAKSKELQAVWSENPEYILAKDQPLGLLGTFSQYLVIEHIETKKQKLILPCLRIFKDKKLSKVAYHKRDFESINSEGDLFSETRQKIDPTEQVLAFDFVDGRLQANSTVEKLYLSYFYLSQRNYPESLKYLEDIPPYNRISEAQWDQVNSILEWMGWLSDRSVEGNAIILRSHALIREELQRPENFFLKKEKSNYSDFQENFYDRMEGRYAEYLEGSNHGPSLLELSHLQEEKWRNIFGQDFERSWMRLNDRELLAPSAAKSQVQPAGRFSDLSPKPPLSTPFSQEKKEVYFLSDDKEIKDNFYFYYEKIRKSNEGEREHLYSFFSQLYLYASKEKEWIGLLILASLVKDPSQLEEILDVSKIRDLSIDEQVRIQSAHFRKMVDSILNAEKKVPADFFSRKGVHRQASRASSSLEMFAGPLHTLKLEHSQDLLSISEAKGLIPLGSVSLPTLNFASKYIEKQQEVSREEAKTFESEWENVLSLGRKERTTAIRYILKPNADLQDLFRELSSQQKGIQSSLQDLEDKIIAAAYPQPSDLERKKRESAAILGGHYPFAQNMSTLIGLFLNGSYEEFAKALPKCNASQIQALNSDIQAFLIQSAYAQQIHRSLQKLGFILNSPRPDPWAVQELGIELFAECSFETSWRPGLVFEYVSDKRLRPKQTAYLNEILIKAESKSPFILTHMIMGGGKTDVFASILGRIWARKDQLSLFLTPASQLKTVQGNLSASQWKNFRQGICTFDYARQDLTIDVLKHIHSELLSAMARQEMVVLKSEMPQILELEHAFLISQPSKDLERIRVLKDILSIFREKTSVIVDEVDEVLRVDRETNFPSGERIQPDQNKVSFIASIYKKLVSDPYILEKMDLLSNQQERMGEKAYREEILPFLAKQIVSHPVFSKVPKEHESSFIKYLCGVLDTQLEEKVNPLRAVKNSEIAFLLWRNREAKRSEIADFIALAKHLLHDILPFTLRKTTDRHYGRKSSNQGKVVPFVATKIPGSTEYGSPWELIAYHFQTALSTPYSKELLQHFLEVQRSAILRQSTSFGIPSYKTPLSKKFEETFGFPFETIEDLNVFESQVNQDYLKKLYIEDLLISEEVTYDPSYYSSNGHNLMSMFPKAMIMTGTPYNRRSYPLRFSDDPLLDPGSEGALLDLLIERNGEIHKVEDSGNLREILGKALRDSPQSKKIRAVIDVGGCLLKQNNEGYARDILSVFENDPSVKGVVFFQIVPTKEGTSKNLVLLKKGVKEPIFLPDTHLSTWKAQGVDPGSLFFLYDQWHSRGTDFPLPPQTVALTILGAEDAAHDILQGVARLRKLHQNQNAIFAISEVNAKAIEKETGEVSIRTILERSFHLEKEKLKNHIFRHYAQELHDCVRSAHLESLLKLKPSQMEGDPTLLLVSQEKSLYKAFGRMEAPVDPMTVLNKIAQDLMDTYAALYPEVRTKIPQILEDAKMQLQYLPKFVLSKAQSLGREQQLQVSQEREVEKENEKEMELEKEWLSFQDAPKGEVKTEVRWIEMEANVLKAQSGNVLKTSAGRQKLKPLSISFSDYRYANPFPAIFSENLYATSNWHESYSTPIPIFSKFHKPGQQLLVVEHGPEGQKRLSGIFLSLAESEFFRTSWLPKQSKETRIWLIDAEGHYLASPKTPLPESADMDELAVQMNLLNGHFDWMIQNLGKTLLWMYKDPETAALKFHFLYLQARSRYGKDKMANLLAHPMLRYDEKGIKGLITEETLGFVTKELLPFVPEYLRSHKK